MTEMPHLQGLTRDWRDHVRSVDLNLSGDEAVYHYDAGGQRVRKVVRLVANTEERFYLGGWGCTGRSWAVRRIRTRSGRRCT